MVPYQLSVPTTCQPARRRLLGDLAGQAGDAGVVVDLDVDLAALDDRARLLRASGRRLRLASGVGVGSARPRTTGGDLALGRLLAAGGDERDRRPWRPRSR